MVRQLAETGAVRAHREVLIADRVQAERIAGRFEEDAARFRTSSLLETWLLVAVRPRKLDLNGLGRVGHHAARVRDLA